MRTKEQLMELGLPKWPQMLVTGTFLPVEQALEIIRRTDTFFDWASGNDHLFIQRAKKLCYMPENPSDNREAYRKEDGSRDDERYFADLSTYYDKMEKWKKDWGTISFEYLINSWISCSFIGGPHGWCHPDGSIGFTNNVGKYPGIEDLYNEWASVANEFPFLELEVTLMSDEEGCHGTPVVSFLIRDGKVEIIDPEVRDIHKEFNRTVPENMNLAQEFKKVLVMGNNREHAISLDQIKAWGDAFAVNHPEYLDTLQ